MREGSKTLIIRGSASCHHLLRHSPTSHQIIANFLGGASLLCRDPRIGGASALFNQGVSPEFIKAIGRWWSGAYLLYIRAMQGNAQKMMVQACSQRCEYIENTPDDNVEGDEE